MLENYWLISGLISIAWIGLIVAYLMVSSRQKKLEEELQRLQEMLETRQLRSSFSQSSLYEEQE